MFVTDDSLPGGFYEPNAIKHHHEIHQPAVDKMVAAPDEIQIHGHIVPRGETFEQATEIHLTATLDLKPSDLEGPIDPPLQFTDTATGQSWNLRGMATCLLTLSGGIDSTVLAHQLVDDAEVPLCVYVDYGTRCRDAEISAARATCKDLGLELQVIDMTVYKSIAQAFILGNSDEVERGSMFWLEGRNAIIGLLLAVMASGLDLTEVYLGINYDDNRGEYVDTDARFVAALNMLILCSMRKEVTVHAPWIEHKMTKSEVIEHGNTLNIDWVRTTHSCSSSIGVAPPCCDYVNCESCISRASDFAELSLPDPFAPPEEPATGVLARVQADFQRALDAVRDMAYKPILEQP